MMMMNFKVSMMHFRSKFLTEFHCLYATIHSTSVYTNSLSRFVYEIFAVKLLRTLPENQHLLAVQVEYLKNLYRKLIFTGFAEVKLFYRSM